MRGSGNESLGDEGASTLAAGIFGLLFGSGLWLLGYHEGAKLFWIISPLAVVLGSLMIYRARSEVAG